MCLFYRLSINIKRNTKKNLLISSVLIIVFSVVSLTISVNEAIENSISNLRKNMLTVVTIEPNFNERTFEWTLEERYFLLEEVFMQLAELPFIEGYEFSQVTNINSLWLRPYVSQVQRDSLVEQGIDFLLTPGVGWGIGHRLKGFSSGDVVYLNTDVINLISGRTFTTAEVRRSTNELPVALISETFATHNNVWIGDTLEFHRIIDAVSATPFEWELDEVLIQTLEVIGVWAYKENVAQENEYFDVFYHDFLNEIWVPNWVISELELAVLERGKEPTLSLVLSYFVLASSSYLEQFNAYADELLPDGWIVYDFSGRFNLLLQGLIVLSNLMASVLIGTIFLGGILISLLLFYDSTKRKEEVGIYLALGQGKKNIILQFILEYLFVAVISLTIALTLGYMSSQTISRAFLTQQITLLESQQEWHEQVPGVLEIRFGQERISTEEMVASMNTSLTAEYIGLFYTISMNLVGGATALAFIPILLIKPKDLLNR